jgi:hypothetical protein
MIKKLIEVIIIFLLLCLISLCVISNGNKFKINDLVYICNEDINDSTPLCITDYPSKVIEIRYIINNKSKYEYRLKVYADKDTKWNSKTWVDEKYIHKWTTDK